MLCSKHICLRTDPSSVFCRVWGRQQRSSVTLPLLPCGAELCSWLEERCTIVCGNCESSSADR